MLDLDTLIAIQNATDSAATDGLRTDGWPARPGFRRARIARLRREIRNGEYIVDADRVAEAIVDRLRELNRRAA